MQQSPPQEKGKEFIEKYISYQSLLKNFKSSFPITIDITFKAYNPEIVEFL